MELAYICSRASSVGSTSMSLYRSRPVPAGISLPMITFSFRPTSGSDLPSIAAWVSTRVVSWKEAADSHESVAREALVMPISSGRPAAGRACSCTAFLLACWNWTVSTSSPGSRSVSPDSMTVIRRVIWRTMTSTCLSWMPTPWERYTPWTSSTRCFCASRGPRMRSTSLGSTAPETSCWPTSTRSPSETSSRARRSTG
ncbi:Uncharacterised protein [Mycobacteroides abscessus subsp. abscessus]|nr:Uncharacterised protein [Mycobacteroides abscessus subsp. abscessus]